MAIAVRDCLDSVQSDEDSLVDGLIAEDSQAWKIFIGQYRNRIFHTAIGILGDVNLAEDVFQEVCLSVARYINKFQKRSGLWTWVWKITYNAALRIARKNKSQFVSVTLTEDIEGENGWTVQERAEIRKSVRRGITKLKGPEQEILNLELGGSSNQEIADALDYNLVTCKVRLHRAKRALGKVLEEF